MRLLLVALLCVSVRAEDPKPWKVKRPLADDQIGLRAPRLLRLERGVGQMQKLQLVWKDTIKKSDHEGPVVTVVKLDAEIRIAQPSEFFRIVEVPIRLTSATVNGKDAMPQFENARFTGKMLATGEMANGLVPRGMGALATELRHKCSLLSPAVPLRRYTVGQVLDIPADRFIRQLGVRTEGAKLTGKAYHHMPEKLFRQGREATIITVFTYLLTGDELELPSGQRYKGELRIKGRRAATYADIAGDGYLKSCTLEMESEHVIHVQLSRKVMAISTVASVTGGPWSTPPKPKGSVDHLLNAARLRWAFRPGNRYDVKWRYNREQDGAKSTAALDGAITIDSVKGKRARIRVLLDRLAVDGKQVHDDIELKGLLDTAGQLEEAEYPDVNTVWKRRLERIVPPFPKNEIVQFDRSSKVPLEEFRSWGLVDVLGGSAKGTVKRVATRPYAYLVVLKTEFDVRIAGDDLVVEGVKGAGEVHLEGTIETRLFMDGRLKLTGVIYLSRRTTTLKATVALKGSEPSVFSTTVEYEGRYPEPPKR